MEYDVELPLFTEAAAQADRRLQEMAAAEEQERAERERAAAAAEAARRRDLALAWVFGLPGFFVQEQFAHSHGRRWMLALGTLTYAVGLAFYARSKGRHLAWGLLATLSLFGWFAALTLDRKNPTSTPRRPGPPVAGTLACLLGVLLGGAALAHAYDAPGGDFRIAFPSDPMVDAAGTNGASYKVADGDRVYVVRRLSCEAECAAQADDARFYDDFQRQGLAALKGTLQSQRAVTSGTHAGREMVIHAESKRTGQPYEMTARVFRLGRDVYVVSSTTPRQPAARGAALGVLDSFVLLK